MFWKEQHKRNTQKNRENYCRYMMKVSFRCSFRNGFREKRFLYSYDIFDLYLLIGSTLFGYRYVRVCARRQTRSNHRKWEILNHPGFLSKFLPPSSQKLSDKTILFYYYIIKISHRNEREQGRRQRARNKGLGNGWEKGKKKYKEFFLIFVAFSDVTTTQNL